MGELDNCSLKPMKVSPPPIQNVGAAITMISSADALIAEASRFAERLDASLTLIHAGATPAEKAAYLEEVTQRLKVPHETHVVDAAVDSADKLIGDARSAGVELLVAGAFEGLAVKRRHFLGPVARQFAERALCSLLLVAHARLGAFDFRRIVVITDFSECSRLACEQALWLAEADRAECVQIVSIHTIFMDARAEFGEGGEFARSRKQEEMMLESFVAGLPGCASPVKRKVIDATTGFAACDFAETFQADLLVLPGHNRTSGRVPPMANWALQVVPCSLWIVHEGTAWIGAEPEPPVC